MADFLITGSIILKDEISEGLAKVKTGIDDLKNKSEDFQSKMRSLSKELSQASASLGMLGTILTAPLAVAFKNAEKQSAAVHTQMQKMSDVAMKFQVSIATAMLPIIEKLNNVLQKLLNAWDNLNPGIKNFIIQGMFVTGILALLGSGFFGIAKNIIQLVGLIPQAVMALAQFAIVNAPLLLIGASIGTLIFLMFKFQSVSDIVLNGIEILWNSIAAAIKTVVTGLAKVFETLTFFNKEMKQYWKEIGESAALGVNQSINKVRDLFSGEQGDLAAGFDTFKEKMKNMFNEGANATNIATDRLKDFSVELERANLLFADNKMSAEDYYNILTSKEAEAINALKMRTDALQNLAEAEMQFSAQSNSNRSKELDSAVNLLNTLQSYQKTSWQSIFDFINTGIQAFSSGFSKAISGIIMGTTTAKEAFQEFGKTLITTIVNFIVEYAVQALIGATIGKALAVATASIAAGLAMAWQPAAYFASVATFGAAAGAGAAALLGGASSSLAGAAGIYSATRVLSFHEGGVIRAHNGLNLANDEVPIIAQTGEGVLSRRGMSALGGASALNSLNRGENGSTVNNFNINVNAVIDNRMDINSLAEQLGFEIERSLSRAKTIG
jgi:hypothetical protein